MVKALIRNTILLINASDPVLNIIVFGRLTLIVIDVNVLLWGIAVMRFGTAYKETLQGQLASTKLCTV